MCFIVCGCVDGYWERGLFFWDVVVGIVILEEVGGKVIVYNNSFFDIKLGKILVINGKIYDLISKVLIEILFLVYWDIDVFVLL